MGYALSTGERNFIASIQNHESLSSISYLLGSILNGVDISSKDLISIEDHCMDQVNELENEGLEVPKFMDSLRDIIVRLINSGAGTPTPEDITITNPLLAPFINPINPHNTVQTPKATLPRKPKVQKSPEEIAERKNKYKASEFNADNVPAYLTEIYNIVEKVVAARCEEEIAKRKTAEDKLAKLQSILGQI